MDSSNYNHRSMNYEYKDLDLLLLNLKSINNLIDFELYQRSRKQIAYTHIFSLDFDLIYGFLLGNIEDELGALGYALWDGFHKNTDYKITLPPGSVHELLEFCYVNLIKHLPKARCPDNLLLWIENECEKDPDIHLDLNEMIRVRLNNILDNTTRSSYIVTQLHQLLNSERLVSLPKCGVEKHMLDYGALLGKQALTYLTHARPINKYKKSNLRDSVNLAFTFGCANSNLIIPLVTGTRTLRKADIDLRLFKHSDHNLPNLIQSPNNALFTLGAHHVNDNELIQLKTHINTTIESVSSLIEDGYNSIPQNKEIYHILDIFHSKFMLVAKTGSALNKYTEEINYIWNVKDNTTIYPKDIKESSVIAYDTLTKVRANIENTIVKLSNVFAETDDYIKHITNKFHEANRLRPYLQLINDLGITNTNGIDKLIFVAEGGTMNEYNIKQRGNNLTSIIDSYKITSSNIGAYRNKQEKEILHELLSSITESILSEDDKKEVLRTTTEVADEISSGKKITGRVKVLWNGIKSLINTVPDAVDAWEKLNKLWC